MPSVKKASAEAAARVLQILESCRPACQVFLGGSPAAAEVEELVGGMSNVIYRAKIPSSGKSGVIVRYFGSNLDGIVDIEAERKCFRELAGAGLAPALVHEFHGGRVEEFLQARPLRAEELPEPSIEKCVVEQLARLHHWTPSEMSHPLQEEFTGRIRQWTAVAAARGALLQQLSWDSACALAQRIANKLQELSSPVVFAHNDLQEENILLEDDSSCSNPKLRMIDFEYAAPNFRGIDLGNHICERMFSYGATNDTGFSVLPEGRPTAASILNFARAYCSAEESLFGKSCDPVSLARECAWGVAAAHLTWCVWAAAMAADAPEPGFSYAAYSQVREEEALRQVAALEEA